MARHLKIFQVEPHEKSLIIKPVGEGASFRYADLQMEANYVRTMVADRSIQNVVIDLGELSYFGSEFIGALITIAREKKNQGGKVAICNVIEEMRDVLSDMSLFKLWPYFETRDEALAHLNDDHSD